MMPRLSQKPASRLIGLAAGSGLFMLLGCAAGPGGSGPAMPGSLQQQWAAATAEPGDPAAQDDGVRELERRADALYAEGTFDKARQAYLDLARGGDKYSQYRLAYMLEHGQGGRSDLAEAFAWATVAAELNDPRIQAYAEHVTERLIAADPALHARGSERAETLFANFSTQALLERRRDLLKRKVAGCTGSRIGACHGSANVSEIDSGRDSAAWASLTSTAGGLGNALGRLRSQDGAQYWGQAREELQFLNHWVRDLSVPAGNIEYGPLILRDAEAEAEAPSPVIEDD
ncbi:MAG: hypothetical protein RQ741_01570 [Wenzhouxiangellaceae bacterium]|nr:hypothetical protein [Wenzhouxiangellaceae bacterium]